jgi:major membrane immunogen (membrane-anchored lipoprotein)
MLGFLPAGLVYNNYSINQEENMNKNLIILAILLLSLPLFACSGNEPAAPAASLESTESDQAEEVAEPPTAEPAVSENLYVTDINEIVGTWVASADLGIFVAIVTPDGMFRVATSSEALEQGSSDSWKVTVEDGQIVATGYALCLGDTGYYLAEIKPDGTLKFITVSDPCSNRIRRMDRSLPGRLTPYDLVFYPVD